MLRTDGSSTCTSCAAAAAPLVNHSSQQAPRANALPSRAAGTRVTLRRVTTPGLMPTSLTTGLHQLVPAECTAGCNISNQPTTVHHTKHILHMTLVQPRPTDGVCCWVVGYATQRPFHMHPRAMPCCFFFAVPSWWCWLDPVKATPSSIHCPLPTWQDTHTPFTIQCSYSTPVSVLAPC
jgi:hypothetical protein